MYLFIGAHQADENVFSRSGQKQNIRPELEASWPQTRARGFEIRDRFKATRDSHESPWYKDRISLAHDGVSTP